MEETVVVLVMLPDLKESMVFGGVVLVHPLKKRWPVRCWKRRYLVGCLSLVHSTVSQISIFSCHTLSRVVTPLTDKWCYNGI